MPRIVTYTGRNVDPLNLSPLDVDIYDVAHALSMTCRFGGHCSEFYSVAEHALRLSWAMEQDGFPRDVVFLALHHDDAEAYLADISAPLKRHHYLSRSAREPRELQTFIEAEEDALIAILSAFGAETTYSQEVREYDRRICVDEWRALMPEGSDGGFAGIEGGLGVGPWKFGERYSPSKARDMFLDRHAQLGGKR